MWFDVGLKRTKNREFGLIRHHHFCPKFRTFNYKIESIAWRYVHDLHDTYATRRVRAYIRVRAMILATLDVFRRCVRNFGLCTRFVRLILTSNHVCVRTYVCTHTIHMCTCVYAHVYTKNVKEGRGHIRIHYLLHYVHMVRYYMCVTK